MMNTNPKYLVRASDFHIFEIDDSNGCYRSYSNNVTYTDGTRPNANEYFTFENLTKSFKFFIIDETEIEIYQIKNKEYVNFVIWQSSSDGHGGVKGGTYEEYLKTKNGTV